MMFPETSLHLFSPVEDSEDIDVFKWQTSPKLLIIWFQLQAFPGRKLFLRICAWFLPRWMSFIVKTISVVSETHKVQELIQACVGLSGKNGNWICLTQKSKLFHLLPFWNEVGVKGARFCARFLINISMPLRKPILRQLSKNRLMVC